MPVVTVAWRTVLPLSTNTTSRSSLLVLSPLAAIVLVAGAAAVPRSLVDALLRFTELRKRRGQRLPTHLKAVPA